MKNQSETGETPSLPIKKTYKNFEMTLDKSIVFGKGDFVVMIQDTDPDGKYFEIYLDKNGQPAALPMEWEKQGSGERWGTTTTEEILNYVKENFSDEIAKISGSKE